MVMALELELVGVRWERWEVITWLHRKPVMSRASLREKNYAIWLYGCNYQRHEAVREYSRGYYLFLIDGSPLCHRTMAHVPRRLSNIRHDSLLCGSQSPPRHIPPHLESSAHLEFERTTKSDASPPHPH